MDRTNQNEQRTELFSWNCHLSPNLLAVVFCFLLAVGLVLGFLGVDSGDFLDLENYII